MAEKIVNLDDFKNEAKRRELKERADEKLHKVASWFEKNKEFLIIAVPAVIGGGKWLLNRHDKKVEMRRRNRTIWDSRSQQWYTCRRDIKPREHVQIEQRKMAGESLGQILQSMRLL